MSDTTTRPTGLGLAPAPLALVDPARPELGTHSTGRRPSDWRGLTAQGRAAYALRIATATECGRFSLVA